MPTNTLDGRAARLDVYIHPGNTASLVLTFPAALTGRTFTAGAGATETGGSYGTSPTVSIVGAVLTVSFTEAQTTTLGSAALWWKLTETTGGGTQDLIVGKTVPNSKGTGSATTAATVTLTSASLQVSIVGADSGALFDYIDDAISALIAGAPGALNTLNELADALGDDAVFATTVTNSLALKAPLASPTFTGNVVVPDADAATEAMNRQTSDARYSYKTVVTVGATNSDYTTPALAFAAYPSGGVIFHIRPGTYDATALAPPPNCVVEGEGDGTVLRLPNGTGTQNVMSIPLASVDVTVRDLLIDGNKANQAGGSIGNGIACFGPRQSITDVHVINVGGYGITTFAGATDWLVRGCTVEDSGKEGIEVQAASRALVVNNRVLRSGYSGIYVWANTAGGGTCADVAVVGNVVDAPGQAVAASGIRVDDGANRVAVTGNTVSNAAQALSNYGIAVFSSTASAVTECAVTGNAVAGANYAAGILVQKATGATVTGNTVTATAIGVQVVSTSTEVSVADNTIRSCTQQGIYCAAATDSSVSGNNVKSCGGTTFPGIEANGVTDCSIVGNVVASSGTQGILVTNSSIGWAVVGNVAAINRRDGIFANSSNGTVTGNVARANSTSVAGLWVGILLTGSDIVAAGNRCYDNQGTKTQGYGIKIGASSATVVLGANDVAGNLTGGLNVDTTATDVQAPPATGFPRTGDPRYISGSGAPGANRCLYLRATGSGVISKIAVDIGTSSGNIDVGVYANTGVGRAARPAARKTSSGSVASPGTGYQEIALTASVYVEEGDWLAVSSDNATVTYALTGGNGSSGSMAQGLSHFQTGTFPLPATAAPSGTNAIYSVVIVGVA